MKPIIISLPMDRGFSFYPFIVLPKRVVGTIQEIPYTKHETTHWERQGIFALIWVIRYLISKKFRMQEETVAFANEIRAYKNINIDVIPHKAKSMATQFWGMCTVEEATSALKKELGY